MCLCCFECLCCGKVLLSISALVLSPKVERCFSKLSCLKANFSGEGVGEEGEGGKYHFYNA